MTKWLFSLACDTSTIKYKLFVSFQWPKQEHLRYKLGHVKVFLIVLNCKSDEGLTAEGDYDRYSVFLAASVPPNTGNLHIVLRL